MLAAAHPAAAAGIRQAGQGGEGALPALRQLPGSSLNSRACPRASPPRRFLLQKQFPGLLQLPPLGLAAGEKPGTSDPRGPAGFCHCPALIPRPAPWATQQARRTAPRAGAGAPRDPSDCLGSWQQA